MHKNLNPGHPREEIVERVTHHADLIIKLDLESSGKGGFGKVWVWVRGSSGESVT